MKKLKIKNLKLKITMPTGNQGYVLVSVLVIMAVMLVITFYLADTLFSEMAIARNQKAATTAFHLAEAGVQEAIWRIQYDETTKDTFLECDPAPCQINFSHDPALLSGGSYSINIYVTAKGVASITSTAFYSMGLKTAQRKIVVNVAKAVTPPPYNYDAALFSGGSTGIEDLTFRATNLSIISGSLLSSREIELEHKANVNVAKDVKSNRNIDICSGCTLTAGGTIQQNTTETYQMPMIDITSDNPGSYKYLAQHNNPPQYYTSKQFDDLLAANPNLTLNGYVYVDGKVDIINDRTLTLNGILAANGSINIGSTNSSGTVIVNDTNPSGLLSTADVIVDKYGQLTLQGLIYTGNYFRINESNSLPVNITGGALVRWLRFEKRTVNITFNADYINRALRNPEETPVIQIQHWEEEY